MSHLVASGRRLTAPMIKISLRGATVATMALLALGIAEGTANAAPVRTHSPAAATVPAALAPAVQPAPKPKNIDALSDYDNAVGALTTQLETTVGTGALIGAPIGCVIGLGGLALAGVGALFTVPFGCFAGAIVGAMAGGLVAAGQQAAEEPGIMEKCQAAMPAWACQGTN